MLLIIVIAIYMVAFLCDRKIHSIIIPCVACEFVGYSPMFNWLNTIDYGMLTFMAWAMIYAYYVLFASLNTKQYVTCGVMILFQLLMSVDSWRCDGDETVLFILYDVIVVFIHCCIISSFLSRRRVITTLVDTLTTARRFLNNNGAVVDFWYNKITCNPEKNP